MTVIQRSLSSRSRALVAAALPLFIGCQDDTTAPTGTAGTAATAGSSGSGGAPTSGGSAATAGSSAGGVATAGTSSGGHAGTAGAGGSAAGNPSGGGGAGGAAGGSGGAAGAGGSGGSGGAAGAACGSIDKANDGSYVRTGWSAEYTCTGGACPAKGPSDTGDIDTKAFDGDYSTRWSTGVYQSKLDQQGRFPLMFTVDMKKSTMISKLSTHPGCQDAYDAPGSIAVSVSTDGTTWTNLTPTPHMPLQLSQGEKCPPDANSKATDVITFPATCARYVRLTGTKRTLDDRYWAIGEMTVSP